MDKWVPQTNVGNEVNPTFSFSQNNELSPTNGIVDYTRIVDNYIIFIYITNSK